ncbi:HNH endonuclease family protein [Arcicella rigui]|uniref:TIGR02646 family protein n=1 Tax=Arcicella rigui TaxID=797020 RepID=A0ABU5QB85_9BACT|nr:hypothetical protein [Arcicella rigui]MEA5140116.1 hypothetical protein [Arcicella rigui]
MRYFKKKQEEDYPTIFTQWLNQNEAVINEWIASTRKGSTIWAEFGKTFGITTLTEISDIEVRNKLLDALYDEQNGLCCYCADKIERNWDEENQCWKYSNYAIEHFLPKNRRKDLIFNYNNLMLTCKESSKVKKVEIGKRYKGKLINSIADLAEITDISETNILEHNTGIGEAVNVGDEIKIPIPPHCDDSKSVFDGNTTIKNIINPCLNAHIPIINRLQFSNEGDIDFDIINNADDLIIENSIEVLNLNCSSLKDRRKNKWNNVERYFTENMNYLLEDPVLLRKSIDKLIVQKALPDSNNELEPFYFVEVAFYQKLIN